MDVTAIEAVADLAGREVVALNFVVSLDGHVRVGETSGPIAGGAGDRALFHALRAHADCVIAGTRTIEAEDYGPLVKDDEWRAVRVAAGLGPEPPAAVLTRSRRVPEQASRLSGEVHVLAGEDAQPRAAIAALRALGHRSILCEGGPTLAGAWLRAGVVDELFIAIAPQLVGAGDPLTMVAAPFDAPLCLELLALLERDGVLFARYGVAQSV